MRQVIAGARVFDGSRFQDGHALVIEDNRIVAILPEAQAGAATLTVEGILAPGFVDLQVNGGGGLWVDGDTDLAALRSLCATHRELGCAGILPTLITNRPEATAAVIAAGTEAARAGVPGFLGLHLEGPHLDPRRKGAHDPALIRPMQPEDLALLCDAARILPTLMVTLAPESVTPQQIAALSGAGAIVSLGHTDCDYDTARAAFEAGATCATHLFNAMSQLGHRSPGLVGAVLTSQPHAGLIADGIHVHPVAMQAALAARPGGIFLVTDCMALAGTEATEMTLGNRRILRRDGSLRLEDGTLAGADLRMDRAIRTVIDLGIAPERALAMATRIPADLIGASCGRIEPGARADMILLDRQFALNGIWDGAGFHPPTGA